MTEKQLQILRNAIGIGHAGREYRNHYCAGAADLQACRELVAAGLMSDGGGPVSKDFQVFYVTEAGKAVARRNDVGQANAVRAAWRRFDYAYRAQGYPVAPRQRHPDWPAPSC